MESLEELQELISQQKFAVGSYCWVDVTHINNPHDFYVRPIIYRRFMPTLQEYGGRIRRSELIMGKVVIFRSKTLHRCIRGSIVGLNCEDECFDIFAIDDGFTEVAVPLQYMRNPLCSALIPPLISQCELADCMPRNSTFSKDAIDAMKYYVGNERAKMIVRKSTNNKLKVDLLNTCPDDIATIMALTQYTFLGGNNSTRRRGAAQVKPFFKHRTFEVNDIINVRCQSGSSLEDFYVALELDHKNYLKERPDFKDYCIRQEYVNVHDAKPGDAVAVLSPKTGYYERATIVAVTEPCSKALVQLVDWGTVLEADLTKFKPVQAEKFYDYPVCAIYCTAIEEQLTDKLTKVLYPGFQFQIKIKSRGDKFNKPKLVQIVEPLG